MTSSHTSPLTSPRSARRCQQPGRSNTTPVPPLPARAIPVALTVGLGPPGQLVHTSGRVGGHHRQQAGARDPPHDLDLAAGPDRQCCEQQAVGGAARRIGGDLREADRCHDDRAQPAVAGAPVAARTVVGTRRADDQQHGSSDERGPTHHAPSYTARTSRVPTTARAGRGGGGTGPVPPTARDARRRRAPAFARGVRAWPGWPRPGSS